MTDDTDDFTDKEEVRKFITYFDILGFECLVDITSYERQKLLADIAGNDIKSPVNVHQMLMRAKFNPQRNPEIWVFTSTVDEATLQGVSEDDPQGLVDLIRKRGKCLWGQHTHPRQVIK